MIVTDQSHVFNCRCILISKVILGVCVLFIRSTACCFCLAIVLVLIPFVVATYPTVLELAGVEEIILPDMWVKFKDFAAGIRFAFVICSWICVMFFTS